MTPSDWEDAFRRLQRDVDPPPHSGVNNSMENTFTYCKHSRYTTAKLHRSMGMNVGWEERYPPSLNFCNTEPEVEDPDGEPLEIDKEDAELTRKRKKLREIEERIILKKAAIALKTVEPFVKQVAPSGLSCHDQSATCEGETLRDRVNLILQQRHSLSFLSKVRSPKKRMNSPTLLEDHPLKVRVKALMKQRCCDPYVQPKNTKVPDVTPPPLSQNNPSAILQESSDNTGFQRFLSVLNKGVDIDLLSRIVNDDSEDLALGEELLNTHPPPAENKSELSNSAATVPGHNRANCGEGMTDQPTQEIQIKRLSLPGHEEKKIDRRESSFGSRSQSKSPLAVKKKKKDEEKLKVDEQREQLQNILQTLGLSLEVEEMSKLTDRTQERLYGKKHEGRSGADSRGEQENRQRGSHQHNRGSSSSRSTSRSISLSPSCSCSHSRASKQRRTSECTSRDGLIHPDGNEDSEEAQDTDQDRQDPKEISSDHHDPHSQDQIYSNPHPATFSDYSLSTCSQYTDHHSGTTSVPTNCYSTYSLGAIPYLDPHLQNTDPQVASDMVYPYHDSSEDINLLVNPDLSKSEGQIGSAGRRYLREISTMPSTTKCCLKRVIMGRRRNATYIRKCQSWFFKLRESRQLKRQARQVKQKKDLVAKVEASQSDEDQPEAKQSEGEERPPTEEEIKANLRKKLEAFNQKVKQQVTQPVNSLTSQTG